MIIYHHPHVGLAYVNEYLTNNGRKVAISHDHPKQEHIYTSIVTAERGSWTTLDDKAKKCLGWVVLARSGVGNGWSYEIVIPVVKYTILSVLFAIARFSFM